jgi:carbon storage regulator
MLVLSRKLGEQIVIGDNIRVTVVAISGDRVGLGFTGPAEVPVRREELTLTADHVSVPDESPAASEVRP